MGSFFFFIKLNKESVIPILAILPKPSVCLHTLLHINGHQKSGTQTLTEYEESHCHVDKDPRETQELHQVVHEQVAFLQTQVGWGVRAEIRFLMTIELHDKMANGECSNTTATQHYSTSTYLRSFRILDSTLILFIRCSSWKWHDKGKHKRIDEKWWS